MCDAYTCGEQASSVGILEGLQRMPQEMRNTFDVIQSCSGTEWFILIVPAGAGKGSAALHVASRLGMSAPAVCTLYAQLCIVHEACIRVKFLMHKTCIASCYIHHLCISVGVCAQAFCGSRHMYTQAFLHRMCIHK